MRRRWTHGIKFALGKYTVSPAVYEEMDSETLNQYLLRHLSGDWGELHDDVVKEEMDRRVQENSGEVISYFKTEDGFEFLIVTVLGMTTTALLPEEY